MQNHISFQEKVKPLIRIVQASQHFKVILVTLETGAILENHTAPARAKIFVVKGTIEYRSLRVNKNIHHMEEFNIPLDEVHQIAAKEAAEFLLIIG